MRINVATPEGEMIRLLLEAGEDLYAAKSEPDRIKAKVKWERTKLTFTDTKSLL